LPDQQASAEDFERLDQDKAGDGDGYDARKHADRIAEALCLEIAKSQRRASSVPKSSAANFSGALISTLLLSLFARKGFCTRKRRPIRGEKYCLRRYASGETLLADQRFRPRND